LAVIVHKGGYTLISGHSKCPIELKLQLPLGNFAFLVYRTKQDTKGIIILARVIDLDQQDELGWFLHSEGREENVWNPSDHIRHLRPF